jgi:aspartyl-tRNA(Asn)/glutamyl-tRNA(Gln) amidotransferase subunit A
MNPKPITRRTLLAGAAAGAALSGGVLRAQPRDLTTLTVADAAQRIGLGSLSPLALTRAYLERIEDLNPRVNAYITVTAERALEQARAREAELAAGRRRGPLHGIPIALKDNVDTAGVLTTAASAVYADRVPAEDAEVARRLEEAGAVILGKLNMHEFAYGGTSAVSHYGPVRNPWDLRYVPGGSSGGSAAAVAARLCAAAIGTDTAASVRHPAASCGVAGLKATHGIASIRGIVPLSEIHDHVGPLARTVADCALVMTAIAGFDPLDPMSIRSEPVDYHGAIGRAVATFRIGIPREPFFGGLDPEIEAAVERAVAVIGGLTAQMRDVALPAFDSGPALLADIYAYHAPLVADPAKRALYQPITLARILDGALVSVPAYVESRRQIALARNSIDAVFADVDALVLPTVMALPRQIDAVLEQPSNEGSEIRNTLPFNVFGIPAISVPCGFSRGGLPIGLQIVGPRLGESNVLALAHAYERATEWHQREPRL